MGAVEEYWFILTQSRKFSYSSYNFKQFSAIHLSQILGENELMLQVVFIGKTIKGESFDGTIIIIFLNNNAFS